MLKNNFTYSLENLIIYLRWVQTYMFCRKCNIFCLEEIQNTALYRIGWKLGFWTQPAACAQGLRASSLRFTSPLEFSAIFRDGFTLRHELTAGREIRDPVPAKLKHVTNIATCTFTMLWLRHVRAGTEIFKKLTSNPRLSAKNTPLDLFPQMEHSLQIFV